MRPSALIIASLLMLGILFTFNISSTLAQPCENNGHSILGKGKQIFKQSNRCIIIENNNTPTSGICGSNAVLQNGACVPIPPSGTPPVANAGQSQTVSEGLTVLLDGTGSFATTSGATIVSYSWTQTSGPTVGLNGATSATPFFTAPSSPTTLTFSLTVTDSSGQTSQPNSVTVTVTSS